MDNLEVMTWDEAIAVLGGNSHNGNGFGNPNLKQPAEKISLLRK